MTQKFHANSHGIMGIFESSGHFGRHNPDGTFTTNLPIFIPETCLTCTHYDPGEPGDYGSKIGFPYCTLNCFFPTRKGTCKRYKSFMKGTNA